MAVSLGPGFNNPWLPYINESQRPLPSHPYNEPLTGDPLQVGPNSIASQRNNAQRLIQQLAEGTTVSGVNQHVERDGLNSLTNLGNVTSNIVQGGAQGFNTYASPGHADQLLQHGEGTQNNADVLGNVGGYMATGFRTTNQGTIGGRLNEVNLGGEESRNDAQLLSGAKQVYLDGTSSYNRVFVDSGGVESLVTAGDGNLHLINSLGDTAQLLGDGSNNNSIYSILGQLAQASLGGTQNATSLYADTLGQGVFAGESNTYYVNTLTQLGHIAFDGSNNTGEISNSSTTGRSKVEFHGHGNRYNLLGSNAHDFLVTGSNQTLILNTGNYSDTPGIAADTADDTADIGGTNQINADFANGDDTVLIRQLTPQDGSGTMVAQLEGGSGQNTLYLEGDGWHTQDLGNGLVQYTRGNQQVVASNFQQVAIVPTGQLGYGEFPPDTPS